jgi:MbtH protein
MAAFLGDDDNVECSVVANNAGQYSIWPPDRALPTGWRQTGFRGTRSQCLTHIEQVWTDPISLGPTIH